MTYCTVLYVRARIFNDGVVMAWEWEWGGCGNHDVALHSVESVHSDCM